MKPALHVKKLTVVAARLLIGRALCSFLAARLTTVSLDCYVMIQPKCTLLTYKTHFDGKQSTNLAYFALFPLDGIIHLEAHHKVFLIVQMHI